MTPNRDPLTDPPAPDTSLERYLKDRRFPPYRFLPGLAPHPTHHPDGHSYREADDEEPDLEFTEVGWRTCRTWLWGVDLFNHGFLWESHEAWEAIWKTLPRDDGRRLLLQGLIQVAAAHIKRLLNNASGVDSLFRAARPKLERARDVLGTPSMGVAIDAFLAASEQGLCAPPSDTRFRLPPPIVLVAFDEAAAP